MFYVLCQSQFIKSQAKLATRFIQNLFILWKQWKFYTMLANGYGFHSVMLLLSWHLIPFISYAVIGVWWMANRLLCYFEFHFMFACNAQIRWRILSFVKIKWIQSLSTVTQINYGTKIDLRITTRHFATFANIFFSTVFIPFALLIWSRNLTITFALQLQIVWLQFIRFENQ